MIILETLHTLLNL